MKKYVLITGACINTGASIVEKFASEGVNVVFTGRDAEKVKNAQERYRQKFQGVKIYGYKLDALDDSGNVNEIAVKQLFSVLDEKGVFVDRLVLNAADLGVGVSVFNSSLADFARVVNTNLLWNYCIIENAAERMKVRGGGNITFINSNTAYRAIPERVAYEASKGGQLGMMRGLALDLGKYNIRVNAVLPGMIKTDRWEKNPEFYEKVPSRFTPLGDVATGDDIADAVWYFAENARNTTGAELVVDGGNMIQLYPVIPENGKE